ncbi:hypothetical protein DFH27DRAFT_611005 [Peziza echinospora]|nr:hypothetical protein DFH27DRAFT_611005 [Peziza echinospora]
MSSSIGNDIHDGVDQVDLVVIGAGWHGLMAAKTYSDVNPSSRIVVLEKATTIGGVWAEHRLYPGLKSNNMLGTYEFSDFPMTGENAFGVKPGEHIPGTVVHQYLKKFAQTFGIFEKCRFSEEVRSAEKVAPSSEEATDGGWILKIAKLDAGEGTYKLKTRKLVVATGLTSQAYIPKFPNQEGFTSPIIHCGDLLGKAEDLFDKATNVAVFGGTKSAWDAAYSFATRGIHVDWIIRESGHGPCWMAPPYVTPLKKWLEKLVSTRFLTWFSPCVWGDADGYSGMRNFLHGNAVGRAITNGFWGVLGNDVITLNAYDKHPETAKLKPWVPAFWVAAGLSILNYPTNFFDLVKEGKITIHIADIAKLEDQKIYLSATKAPIAPGSAPVPESIKADALLCSTGWTFVPSIKFFAEGGKQEIDASSIGLPYHSTALPTESESQQIKIVDDEILSRFPVLKSQPSLNPALTSLRDTDSPDTPNRPFNLYRLIVPPAFINDHSIVFNGMVQTISLWLTAYLDGRIKLPTSPSSDTTTTTTTTTTSLDAIKKETLLHNRFGKWRYPGGYGASYPDFVFDAIPYVDLLLGDLGVKINRKGGALRECFEPYGTADYVGIVEEWKELQGLAGVGSAEGAEGKKLD